MKTKSASRMLTKGEVAQIQKWLRQKLKQIRDEVQGFPSVADMAMNRSPSEWTFGRYANPDTSSQLIYDAARFVSRMHSRFSDFGDVEIKPPKELYELHYFDLCEKVKANDFEFFECVAAMLRHRKQKKTKIGKIPWRDMKKFSEGGRPSKPAERSDHLKAMMGIAVYKVLCLRAPFPNEWGDKAPGIRKAVTRNELKKALRDYQIEEGIDPPSKITEQQLSKLLHTTASGQFLAPLMAEQPIMRRKQKLQPTRNRRD